MHEPDFDLRHHPIWRVYRALVQICYDQDYARGPVPWRQLRRWELREIFRHRRAEAVRQMKQIVERKISSCPAVQT